VTRLTRLPRADDKSALMVPYRMVVAAPGDGAGPPRRLGDRPSKALVGRLFLEGRSDEFRIRSAHEPLELTLDPRGEILARFYSATEHPKRVLVYQALDRAAEGRWGEAEALYSRALDAGIGGPPEPSPTSWMRDAERDADYQNAKIHLALARICVDQDREDEALEQIEAAERLLGPDTLAFRVERDALRSRIDVRRGEFESAYRRLKNTFRQASPRGPVSWQALMGKLQLTGERLAMTEAFALHAVAAFETGDDDEMRWALREARERGADVSALERAIDEREVGHLAR
jgi:tetratricopeptide (TPR) repeat protein